MTNHNRKTPKDKMLYNKQLYSIEELRAERVALKKSARKKLDKLELKSESKGSNILGVNQITTLTSSILGHSKYTEFIHLASEIALPYILKQVASKKAKKVILKATSEVLLGYAKWKAISILVGLISDKIKQKKESK